MHRNENIENESEQTSLTFMVSKELRRNFRIDAFEHDLKLDKFFEHIYDTYQKAQNVRTKIKPSESKEVVNSNSTEIEILKRELQEEKERNLELVKEIEIKDWDLKNFSEINTFMRREVERWCEVATNLSKKY